MLLVTGQYGLELAAAVRGLPEIGGSFTQSGGVDKYARVPSTPIIRNSRLVYIGVSPCKRHDHINLAIVVEDIYECDSNCFHSIVRYFSHKHCR